MKVILTEEQIKYVMLENFNSWMEANKDKISNIKNSFDMFSGNFKLFGGLKNAANKIGAVASSIGNIITNKNKATSGIKMSNEGIELLKKFEGCRLERYSATEYERQNNITTIGYGHVIKSSDPEWLRNANSITQQQADQILRSDLTAFENSVAALFDNNIQGGRAAAYSYPQSLIDVLISIAYNAGPAGLQKSPIFTALKRVRFDSSTKQVNNDDLVKAIPYIRNSCITQNGKALAGLENRRNTEYNYVASSLTA